MKLAVFLTALITLAMLIPRAHADDDFDPRTQSRLWEMVLDPQTSKFQKAMNEVEQELGRRDQQKKGLENLAKLGDQYPSRWEPFARLGEFAHSNRDWKECVAHFEKADKRAQSKEARQRVPLPEARSYLLWSSCLAHQKKYQAALDAASRGVNYATSSSLPLLQARQGELQLVLGQVDAGMDLLTAAWAGGSRAPEVAATIAAAYVRQGAESKIARYLRHVSIHTLRSRMSDTSKVIPPEDAFFRLGVAEYHFRYYARAQLSISQYIYKETDGTRRRIAERLLARASNRLGQGLEINGVRPRYRRYRNPKEQEVLERKLRGRYSKMQTCIEGAASGRLYVVSATFRRKKWDMRNHDGLTSKATNCIQEEFKDLKGFPYQRITLEFSQPMKAP